MWDCLTGTDRGRQRRILSNSDGGGGLAAGNDAWVGRCACVPRRLVAAGRTVGAVVSGRSRTVDSWYIYRGVEGG